MKIHRILIVALSLQLVIFMAHAQTGHAEVIAPLVSSTEEEKLRETLRLSAPANATPQQLEAFFGRQMEAANSLGEFAAALEISRRWMATSPTSETARWTTWRLLFRSDQITESHELGKQILDAHERGRDENYVRAGARMARDLTISGRLTEAEALLKQIEPRARNLDSQFKIDIWARYGLLDAKAKWAASWCELHLARAQHAQAISQCSQSLDMMSERFGLNVPSSYWRTVAANDRSDALLDLARVQIAMGRYFDAEQTLGQALKKSADAGVRHGRHLVGIYNALALIRASQQRIPEARELTQRALRVASIGERGKLGNETRNSHEVMLRLLVIQQAWPAALAEFDVLDQLSVNNPELQSRVSYPLTRALTYAYREKGDKAVNLIDKHLDTLRSVFGERHVETGFGRGVRGIVLASMPMEAHQAEARSELEAAVHILASVDSPGREGAELGDRPTIRRLIFERYLEVIGSKPDAATAAAAFAVADGLGASSLKNALSEAAARSAADTAGLGDLVRSDQDASYELKTLYDFLARQATAGGTQRVDANSAAMRSRIQELETLRAGLRAKVSTGFPEYEKLVNPGLPVPAEVARLLGQFEAFVAVFPTTHHTYVWAVRHDGATVFNRTDLNAAQRSGLVQRLRYTLDVVGGGSQMPMFDQAASQQLYDFLLKPIESFLQGRRQLIVATGGDLAQIPFAVLQTKAHSDPLPKAPWLIKDYAITHVPSASAWIALNQLRRSAAASEVLLGWGDPAFSLTGTFALRQFNATRKVTLTRANVAVDVDREAPRSALNYSRIPPLPDTRDELKSIAVTLGADPAADLLLGAGATRGSVLANSRSGLLARKRVVVFATHGLVAGDLPNLSQPALAMAATGNEANDPLAPLLTLDDVLTLKLNADWVVLSACNTAAADGKVEEALSGLARGFFYAGARSLLVTHWAVDSESAMRLTTSTFEHYATNPKAPKAESLRQAMLKVMGRPEYGHPAFWAPYALVGDGAR